MGKRAAVFLAAVLGHVFGINIDGRLQVIKSDCFERLAIGQRLDSRDVYRKTDAKTVSDCRKDCTDDGEKCRSFSFGIGVKGNTTCEMTSHVIKETLDYRPIGTRADTDYDLYIKKLGCKLVLEEKRPELSDAVASGYEVTEQPHFPVRPFPSKRPNYGGRPGAIQSSVGERPFGSYGLSQDHEHDRPNGSRPGGNRPAYVQNFDGGGFTRPSGPYGSYGLSQDHEHDRPNGSRPGGNRPAYVQNFDGAGVPRPPGPYGSYGLTANHEYDRSSGSRPEGNRPTYVQSFDGAGVPRPPGPFGSYGLSESHEHVRPNGSRPGVFDGGVPRPIFDGPDNPYFSGKPPRPRPPSPYWPGERPQRPDFGGLYGDNPNKIPGVYGPKFPHQKPPIITESVAPDGQIITSIITEIIDVCFRRALAGRRVVRAFVRRSLSCERIEDCQQECTEEKRFICEGFNYRLDLTGRGRGDCELLEVPYIRLDLSRDILQDPDCDYYTKDRNRLSDCKRNNRPFRPESGYRPQGGGPYLPGNEVGPYGGTRPSYYGSIRPISGGDVSPPYYGSVRPIGGGDVSPPYYGSVRPIGGGDVSPPYYGSVRPIGGGDGSPPYSGSARPIGGDVLPPYYGSARPIGGDVSGSRPPSLDGGGYGYDRPRPTYNRRNDHRQSYHTQDTYGDRYSFHARDQFGHHYPGIPYVTESPDYKPPYDYKSYEPYLPSHRYNHIPQHVDNTRYDRDRERDRNYWGLDRGSSYGGGGGRHGQEQNQRNHDYGGRIGGVKDWGKYGGSYGGGDGYFGQQQNWRDHDYGGRIGSVKDWGKYGGSYGNIGRGGEQNQRDHDYGGRIGGVVDWGKYGGSYGTGGADVYASRGDNEIAPPRRIGVYPPSPTSFDLAPPQFGPGYVNDDCSLRSVAGFRLYNGVVKKIISAPGVYECEVLCFKERDFACNSYAYRYTSRVDNCYLSDKNYKELDYYTDVEQDRDCDVYTMHNRKQCGQPPAQGRDDCFLLARSAQRLDQSCVRDSLNVGSIVDCQIECLKSTRFICRSFSYRYGPPPLAGVIDSCQLSDVPYYDLNPRSDLVTEPGFVLYERRSFGRGCELTHFPVPPPAASNLDELCYIGYVYPAVLLPQATRKSMRVEDERGCRRECTRCREETIFHCMSFGYRSSEPPGKPNCFLSDIFQRDLAEKIDYIPDPNSWLFAWDHYNPKCYPRSYNEHPNSISRDHEYNLTDFLYDNVYGLDTWKMYSVGGWPCKRGTCCRQDREIGFWFCELEGGSPSAWDYCCRPDHHCGYSRGYSYQWCYVGSSSTQWRKCNDRYYPYTTFPGIDRDYHPIFKPVDGVHSQLYPPLLDPPSHSQGNHREPRPWVTRPITPDVPNTLKPPHFRPDRPPAPPTPPPIKPSLDQYEMQFDQQFLDPPKPGGFGQPRYWPVSYLHKETPPNVTAPKFERMRAPHEPKLDAIHNLIDVIKSNDLKDVRYQITNSSDKADDVLFVQIPLPTNFSLGSVTLSEPVDLLPPKEPKGTPKLNQNDSDRANVSSAYRKGYVTKTSVANHGRKGAPQEDDDFSIF